MEFYVQRLSEQLVSRGHEITVFTASNSGGQSTSWLNGVKVCRLPTMTKIYNVPILPSLFNALVEAERPDVIHAHQYPVFLSDVSVAAARVKKTPLIIHVHVISDPKSPISGVLSKIYYSTLGLHTLQSADCVVVPSQSYRDKIIKMRVNASKVQVIKVIPYGIDSKKFQTKSNIESFKKRYNCQNSKVILSVGRLNYQKGFQFLIRAIPNIVRSVPNVKLLIVGDGEDRAFLTKLSRTLGVSDSVIFTGALSQDELPNAYATADIFVLPSLFESFGISLIEAQASGKPVIGTRSGGTPEALVEGSTGLLVEPGNVLQLEAAILRLLLDNDLSLKMGDNGKTFVQKCFEIETIVNNMIDCYQQLSSSYCQS